MNKPQRPIEYLTRDEAGNGDTSYIEKTMDVGRVAQLEFDRFSAASKFRAPASSNTYPAGTAISDDNEIGENLRAVALAKHLFGPPSMNPKFPKAQLLTLTPIQEWDGYVVEIVGDQMIANISDISVDRKRAWSTVEIPLKELNECIDIARVRPGLFFRWAVGYLRTASGTRVRGSNIVFRDLPQWTRRDLAEARGEAAKMAEYFSRADDQTDAS